jgi:predicted glutamine amidotransferase
MCRWIAYSGDPVLLESLLIKPKNSLFIDQSISSKSAETPTNADGFGVGWYDKMPTPGLYRSIRPAWNDFNIRDLAAHIESHLVLAHVRATSMATVQETNCHPFRHKNWLYVHNGEIFGVEAIRQYLTGAVAEEFFTEILGTTDSEVMFYLALTFGLETDPLGGLARMAGFVEEQGRSKGIHESLWMTLGVSDGNDIYAVRYASDGNAPTLYYSREGEAFYRDHPEVERTLSPASRFVVSEPGGKYTDLWIEVPQNSCLHICRGRLEIMPFKPIPPSN